MWVRRCLLAWCLLLPHLPTPADAAAPTTEQHRALYHTALANLRAGRLHRFESVSRQLADYPLLPYLEYRRRLRYISSATWPDIAAFRQRWQQTPLADQLLRQWLKSLVRHGQWALYWKHYDAQLASSATMQCHYHRSQLETGNRREAFLGAEALWLVGHSQPDACNWLFQAWRKAGGITDALAWQRLALALGKGNKKLARYLLRHLQPASLPLAEQFIMLHSQPARLARLPKSVGSGARRRKSEIIAHTLQRLARRDAKAAHAQWDIWSPLLPFTDAERQQVRRTLIRSAARQDALTPGLVDDWPPQELDAASAQELLSDLAHNAIRDQRWSEAIAWIEHLPEAERKENSWQYWYARATLMMEPELLHGLGSVGQTNQALDQIVKGVPVRHATSIREQSVQKLALLAMQRDYYGFMAANHLNQPYAMQAASTDLTRAELLAINQHPAMRRIVELRAVGQLSDSRRELSWLMPQLTDRQLLALAEYARQAGWPRQSIKATTLARHWDYLELRFPIGHRNAMFAYANRLNLNPDWLLAIARQESSFMHDALSPSGALGVMQVMPSTALITARKYSIPFSGDRQLLNADTNIHIGARYLRQMYDRFQRNRILASAAYNAGPTRMSNWLSARKPMPADVFIESIPFHESRNYVKNVLSFSLIYSRLLGRPRQRLLDDHEQWIGNARCQTPQCNLVTR